MPPAHRPSISSPHSLSLKVLRLSAPSLATAEPLPTASGADEATTAALLHRASLAHPAQPPGPFPLTPLLTLPPSFGAAYVGETFSCAVCANNERRADEGISVTDVRVGAELQTPAGTTGLDLEGDKEEEGGELEAGRTVQRIVRRELVEEGACVLAVTVAYKEAKIGEEGRERERTFRKLYQFVARQAVGVRTKVGMLKGERKGWAVEAQVENLTDQSVVLDGVGVELAEGLEGRGLNSGRVVLAVGDVQQVAFRLERKDGEEVRVEGGRYVLAQLRVDWRMGMGQDGTLRTGWLGCLKKD